MFSDRTNWKLTRNRFTKALEEVRAAGREVLDLTIANPTRAGFDYDQAAILAALALTGHAFAQRGTGPAGPELTGWKFGTLPGNIREQPMSNPTIEQMWRPQSEGRKERGRKPSLRQRT